MEILLQLLGIGYFVFALWNLRLAVVMLPLFFPAYLLKFDLVGVPFPLVEVFIYASFVAWVLQILVQLVKRKLTWSQIVEPFKKVFWIPIAGIIVAAVISTFITPQSVVMMDGNTIYYGRKVALGILKSWIIAPVMMLVLFAWFMKTAKDMKFALDAYFVSAVILAVWGVYQVLTGHYDTPDSRASGPFNSANYLALYITPALFYAGVRLREFFTVHELSWFQKFLNFVTNHREQQRQFFIVLLWIAAFFVMFFALLFTKSYAAFLAFFVTGLIWMVMNYRNWKKFPWKIVLGVVLVLGLIVTALIVLDPTKWQVFFNLTERTSSGVRVEIYTIATALVKENFLQGIGLGMFPAVYQLQGPSILGHLPYELNMLHPHNIFLAFWLNLGFLGFVSFLWIVAIMFSRGWKRLQMMSKHVQLSSEWFSALGLLLFMIIFFHGFVDTPFFKNDLALLFWLIFAITVFSHRTDVLKK